MPQRKTAAEKRLTGNAGKRPIVDDPAPPIGAPSPPPRGLLTAKGRRFWQEQMRLLEQNGRLTPLAGSSLTMAALHFDAICEAAGELKRAGVLQESDRGALVQVG